THLAVVGSQGGIDTLTINAWRDAEGEVSAASSVSVVVDDTWAVAGEGEGADFTIDATDVVTLESEENAVFVNATQERDARLEIKGSATSANILLGGAQADTIIGGEADDVLYGGFDIEATGARQYVVRFNTTDFDPAAGIDLTFDADGAGGAGAINVTVQAGEGYLGEGEAALTDFMELFEHLPSLASASPDGRFEAEGAGQWTFETLQHGYITITLSGATTDPDAVEAMLSDFFIKANVDEDGPYLLFRNDTND